MIKDLVQIEDFEKLDIRVGRIVDIQRFPEGRYSTHILMIDFGEELGIKKSLAKLAPNYDGPELLGRWCLRLSTFPLVRLASIYRKF